MKPYGRFKKLRFPRKRKEWFGKGILMWWEDIVLINKKNERHIAKLDIIKSIID